GGMTLPISLEYDASGVKVESIASCVGQNWTLNVGGTVSRIIKSGPDEGNISNVNLSLVDVNGYYLNYGLSKLDIELNKFIPSDRYTQFVKWIQDVNYGNKDGQPDLFYFSTPQGGCKFVFNDQRQVVYLENSDFIIKEDFVPNFFRTWKAISPSGLIYKFGNDNGLNFGLNNAVEKNYSSQIGEVLNENNYKINSWFLTEISNSNNSKKIQLDYIENNYTHKIVNIPTKNTVYCLSSLPNGSQCYDNADYQYYNFVQSPYSSDSPESMTNTATYLQNHVKSKLVNKIKADTIEIIFTYSNRDDLENEGNSFAKKLDEISIYDGQNCIKKISFSYSNIISTNPNIQNITNSDLKRLQLNSVIEKSCDNIIVKPYVFEYNNTLLPHKLSFSQDKWGYFNGKNNTTMFPKKNFYDNFNFVADRSVDLNFAKAGALEKITYPTKGTINFEFEKHISNSPTDYKINTNTMYDVININPNPTLNGSYNIKSFTYNQTANNEILILNSSLMFPSPLNGSYNPTGLAPAYCTPSNSTAVELIDATNNNQTIQTISYSELSLNPIYNYGQINYYATTKQIRKVINPNLLINGHTYIVKVYGYGNCFYNSTQLKICKYDPIYDVGGLRIKKITNKNYDNTIIKETFYNYNYPKITTNPVTTNKVAWNFNSTYPSNYHLNFYNIVPSNASSLYSQLIQNVNFNGGHYMSGFYYTISSGRDPLDLNFAGPNISYGEVTETDNSNGFTKNTFNTYKNYLELNNFMIDDKMPPLPKFQTTLAGEKTSILITNNNGLVTKINNFEHNYTLKTTNVKGIITNVYDSGLQFFNTYTLQGQTKTLKKETETSNFNNNLLSVTKEYEYENLNHN
ncbi:type IV secretion protein Rhs, partial [Flavobacterium branchiophilum]